MEENIVKRIEKILNDEKTIELLGHAGKGKIAPVKRVSDLIGEIFTYCFVHNDGKDIDVNEVLSYVKKMDKAYFECHGDEDLLLDRRAKELGVSIASKLNIDLSEGTVSKEDEQKIQDYFLKNYVENGYVMHSFPGAAEESIRKHGFSSSKRIWDNDEIMNISRIFEEKNVISPVGAYSHYSGGGMYVENNPKNLYSHALCAPEWFKWFTSSNHNKNSSKIEDSPYYLKDYEGCKQNVLDLCKNAELNESETTQVMSLFEKNWELLGTEKLSVALIPKSVIGKANIEDATIPGQSIVETLKTVLGDKAGQYTEHEGNVLKQTITEKDMLIMNLPKSRELFGEHEYNRETKEELYDPKLVLDMIYRGTVVSGFELSEEKINSVIDTLRQVHNYSSEVEAVIDKFREKVAEHEAEASSNEVSKVARHEVINSEVLREGSSRRQEFLDSIVVKRKNLISQEQNRKVDYSISKDEMAEVDYPTPRDEVAKDDYPTPRDEMAKEENDGEERD